MGADRTEALELKLLKAYTLHFASGICLGLFVLGLFYWPRTEELVHLSGIGALFFVMWASDVWDEIERR